MNGLGGTFFSYGFLNESERYMSTDKKQEKIIGKDDALDDSTNVEKDLLDMGIDLFYVNLVLSDMESDPSKQNKDLNVYKSYSSDDSFEISDEETIESKECSEIISNISDAISLKERAREYITRKEYDSSIACNDAALKLASDDPIAKAQKLIIEFSKRMCF